MKKHAQAGNALVMVIVGVLVVAVAGFSLWRWWGAAHPAQNAQDNNTAGLTTSSDDASLDKDLSTINKSLSQEQTDGSNANAALNDQQQEIAVPTE